MTVTSTLLSSVVDVVMVAIDESVIVMLVASVTLQDNVTVEPGTTSVSCEAVKELTTGEPRIVTWTGMEAVSPP